MPGPKKPVNPNTWQGQILDSLEDIRLTIESIATGSGSASGTPSWRDGDCVDCIHYEQIGSNTFGWCRRFPPDIEAELADGTQDSTWAQVNETDHCAEFRPLVP